MKCDRCAAVFKVDVFVPYEFWQTIRPRQDGKGGYLCPACILAAVEAAGVVVAGLSGFVTQADLDGLKREMLAKEEKERSKARRGRRP